MWAKIVLLNQKGESNPYGHVYFLELSMVKPEVT